MDGRLALPFSLSLLQPQAAIRKPHSLHTECGEVMASYANLFSPLWVTPLFHYSAGQKKKKSEKVVQ
jgi:hypothetical protein